MFNLLLVFLPALACIARDPNEGKEKVHSFEVKYNVSRHHLEKLLIPWFVPHQRAKRREKRQILPENFLPGVLNLKANVSTPNLLWLLLWVSSYMSSSITEMQRWTKLLGLFQPQAPTPLVRWKPFLSRNCQLQTPLRSSKTFSDETEWEFFLYNALSLGSSYCGWFPCCRRNAGREGNTLSCLFVKPSLS